jgi:hypothetical protein
MEKIRNVKISVEIETDKRTIKTEYGESEYLTETYFELLARVITETRNKIKEIINNLNK